MAVSNGVVLIHGAWHDHHTWDAIVPLLSEAGCRARAIDLPGAGANALLPTSFTAQPFDPAAFGTEPSPNAGVTQDERTEAVIATVRELNAETGGKAVVVGHSLGGLTVSPVAEAIPDEVSAAVYLTAFMLPPGMASGEIIEHDTMADAMVLPLVMADPEAVGALRLHVASTDADYLARAREAFYGDLTDDQFAKAVSHLHPDEPAQVLGVPSNVSKDRFGSVSRHYIECTKDNAIPIAGQREMIRLMDDAMGSKTAVHTFETSHSPFHSAAQELAQVLLDIAKA
ncbi:MAG: alpha/beta fold hydrolase [Pseudomonadota bacterium]